MLVEKSCLQCIKFNMYLLNKCLKYSGHLCSHLFLHLNIFIKVFSQRRGSQKQATEGLK